MIDANKDKQSERDNKEAKKWSGFTDANQLFQGMIEIVERLDKRIKEVTPSAPYNISHSGLVWTPEVFSILKIELNKIKVGNTYGF